mgnify:CR=1 FL=1
MRKFQQLSFLMASIAAVVEWSCDLYWYDSDAALPVVLS